MRQPELPRHFGRVTPRLRRTSLIAAGAGMALLVAACGSNSSANSSSGGKSSGGKEVLKIATWHGTATSPFNQINKDFMKKYPNIKVELDYAPDTSGPYKTLLQTTVDNRTAGIVTNTTAVNPLPLHASRSTETAGQFWATSGAFISLNGQSFLKDYQKAALASDLYKGQQTGLPYTAWNLGIFYNKTLFKKYGLKVPTTYNEFIKVLQTFKSKGIIPLFDGLGGVGGSYLSFLYDALYEDVWGSTLPNDDLSSALTHNKVKWTDPKDIQVLSELHAVAQYLEPGYAGTSYTQMPGSIASGKAAMLLDGSWDVGSVVKDSKGKYQFGYFPVPGSNNPADNKSVLSVGETFNVVKGAPSTDAAMKWLAFFSSPKEYAKWIVATGASSTEVGSDHFPGVTAKTMGNWFGKGWDSPLIEPAFPASGSFYDQSANWPTMLLDVAQGSKSPQAAAETIQKGWP